MKNILRVTVVASMVVLAGCATHYRESLEKYRAAEPLPFYQRTMDWIQETPTTEAAEPSAPEVISLRNEIPEPKDRFEEVASRVLGVPQEWFRKRLEMYSDRAVLEGALKNHLQWQDSMVAVTLMNPGVQAARDRWLATLQQYSQADFLEGLLREYGTFTRYLDVGAGEPLNKEMVKEFFPYPSTISLKGEMIRQQVRIAELEWERVLRDALVDAGSQYFDYQFQYRGAATVEENVRLLDDLVNVVQDRYRTGVASQADLLRLQTEYERQRNLLKDFHARQRSDAAAINAALGRGASAPLGSPGSANLDYRIPAYDALVATAQENRQEVLAQEARVSRTEIAIRMGEVMNRPLFTQGYSVDERGMMPEASVTESKPSYGLNPKNRKLLPAYAQAEAYLAEMRQRLEGERKSLQQVVADTGALARTLLEQADIAHRQVQLVEEVVLPLSQSAYDVAQQAYTAGSMSFIDMLDSERKLIDARLELDKSRLAENQALLRLSTVRGFLTHVDGGS